jgi:aminoglycoside phosphotransferase (APT) family kinase protein
VPQGIHVDNVTEWFSRHVPEAVVPLRFEAVTGGHSNLTFTVTDGHDRRYVLRRPPLHQVLATAHDMEREARILMALATTGVPVPVVRGLCTDSAVNECPFYVMDHVAGLVVRDGNVAASLVPAVRREASRSVVETLAALHAVDPDVVGLGGLAKREDYIARQLKRWRQQYGASATVARPQVDELHDQLAARIPPQPGATIVHGDYRLDNCMVDAAGQVVAVFDWELATLGDPLVDLAQLLVYWVEPGDTVEPLENAPTAIGGFASRQELVDWYSAATARPVNDLSYYLAFASWRLGCILEGVYSRYLAGAMGEELPRSLATFTTRIDGLFAAAADHVARVS